MSMAGKPAEVVVSARGLTKHYGDDFLSRRLLQRPPTIALSNLNLDIYQGEVFGLLGPNGSGKTTAIKLLLGLLFPTRGEVKVLGRDPRDVESKRQIGYLPEETYLYRYLDAFETLDFYGKLFNLAAGKRREKAQELIRLVRLDRREVCRRRVRTYSKGQGRRLGLAVALVNDPQLVILDEPTAGLDPIGTAEMKQVIRQLREAGKTVLLSSHLLADVEDVCDRICILFEGVLRVIGKVDQLLAGTGEVQLTVRSGGGKAPQEAVVRATSALAQEGCQVQVAPRRERLEDLFLRVVGRSREEAETLTRRLLREADPGGPPR